MTKKPTPEHVNTTEIPVIATNAFDPEEMAILRRRYLYNLASGDSDGARKVKTALLMHEFGFGDTLAMAAATFEEAYMEDGDKKELELFYGIIRNAPGMKFDTASAVDLRISLDKEALEPGSETGTLLELKMTELLYGLDLPDLIKNSGSSFKQAISIMGQIQKTDNGLDSPLFEEQITTHLKDHYRQVRGLVVASSAAPVG